MLTCKNDNAFKNVFYDRKYLPTLQKIVNAITDEEIKILGYENNELANDKNDIKRKLLDLVLSIEHGTLDIEVNGFKEFYSHERNMSYICNLYNSYTESGEKAYDKNYQIMQINLSYGLGTKFGIRKYIINTNNNKYVKNFTIYDVNMDYFMKIWYSQDVEEIIKYRYIIMLNLQKEDLQRLYEISKDKEVKRFMDKMEEINSDEKFVRFARTEEEKKLDEKFAYDNGREAGEIKGIAKGKLDSQVDIAKKMLKDNIPFDMISKYTNLSEKKIKSL